MLHDAPQIETRSDADLEAVPRPRPWGQDRRLEFIEFRLLWDGKINRGEVAEYFNISVQQASLDFAKYLDLAKQNMEYDRHEKVYRATAQFKPLFLAPDTQTYLNEIQGLAAGTISRSVSFVGTRPPCDVVTLPSGAFAQSCSCQFSGRSAMARR